MIDLLGFSELFSTEERQKKTEENRVGRYTARSIFSCSKNRLMMTREDWKREGKEWAQSIIVALILTLIIRTFIIQAFKIPSGSMRPTLMEGDKLFVNKYVYRFHPPQRGDIIVFKYPEDMKKDFIKRLVAFENETVEIKDGKIYVDQKALEDSNAFGKFYYYNHDPFGGPGEKIRVPKDSYYVLGDNSANSTDSRFWGFVPKANLVGKAVFRWWPPRKIGTLK